MAHVVDWDGEHVPAEMRSLPPGRYLVEPLDEAVALTPEENEWLGAPLALRARVSAQDSRASATAASVMSPGL
jgi:hypothetical protein